MSGLQLMIESYTQNPSYGDVNKFRGELDKVTHKVQVLESDLFSLTSEMNDIVSRLGTPQDPADPQLETVSLCGSESHSSGYPSSASSLEVGDVESQYGGSLGSYRSTIQSLMNNSPGLYLPPTAPHQPYQDDGEEGDELPLPPPPPELVTEQVTDQVTEQVTENVTQLVTALYQFEVMTEGNINMREGEQLYRLGHDEEGWMKVRRQDGTEEGYVPTSFLKM